MYDFSPFIGSILHGRLKFHFIFGSKLLAEATTFLLWLVSPDSSRLNSITMKITSSCSSIQQLEVIFSLFNCGAVYQAGPRCTLHSLFGYVSTSVFLQSYLIINPETNDKTRNKTHIIRRFAVDAPCIP